MSRSLAFALLCWSAAAAAGEPVCMKDSQATDYGESKVSLVEADATTIHVCTNAAITDGTMKVINNILQCFAVDRGTGTYATYAPPRVALAKQPKLSATKSSVKICDAGGGKCTTLTPSKHAKDQGPLAVSVSDDGAHALVMIPGEQVAFEIFDVKTKKRTGRIDFNDPNRTCGSGRFVGDQVFVNAGVCAGPGANGFIFDRTGKRLAQLGSTDDSTNSYDAAALHLDGTRWVFALPYDDRLIIADVASGQQSAAIELTRLRGPQTTGAPSYMLAKTSDGKVVIGSGMASVGIIDPASGALLAAWTAPACPPSASP